MVEAIEVVPPRPTSPRQARQRNEVQPDDGEALADPVARTRAAGDVAVPARGRAADDGERPDPLADATPPRDVEEVLEQLRETEILRAVAADEAAASRSASAPTPACSGLIEAADEPWSSILADHRDAFLAISAEIDPARRGQPRP